MDIAIATDLRHTARLSCRVDSRVKQRAEEAAALLGQSITTFTEVALTEKAESVLERYQLLQLTEREFERFVNLIATASPPTNELVTAMKSYEFQRSLEPTGNW